MPPSAEEISLVLVDASSEEVSFSTKVVVDEEEREGEKVAAAVVVIVRVVVVVGVCSMVDRELVLVGAAEDNDEGAVVVLEVIKVLEGEVGENNKCGAIAFVVLALVVADAD
jgi:hypothetical protein